MKRLAVSAGRFLCVIKNICKKNTLTLKSAAKVRKFIFMTKFSRKNPDFVKSTLQNTQIYI